MLSKYNNPITILAFLRLRKTHTKSIKTHQEEQSLLNKKFDDLQVDKLNEDVLKEIYSLLKSTILHFMQNSKNIIQFLSIS